MGKTHMGIHPWKGTPFQRGEQRSLRLAEPELGEWRCPNGHDSSIPPQLPEVMFEACGHYRPIVATWNEFCITCGKRHAPLAIYWRAHSSHRGTTRANNPKNCCGYCGAKMATVRASR